MAHAAISELCDVDLVLLNQLAAQGRLICGLPCHVKDFTPRSDSLGGVLMAIETPPHVQRVLLPSQGHLVHLAVASCATNALVHMNAMVKKDEIRQVVDGASVQSWEWQVMHVSVGGMPAKADFSTEVWQ